VDEYVLSAVGRLDESKTLLRVEELYDTLSHMALLVKRPSAFMTARPSRGLLSEFGVI
jgi:hypothetical protein